MAEFRGAAQKEAQTELERLRKLTQMDVEKIGLAAKAEIDAAERAARVELKALAAKLAVDGAESLVAKQMTPAVQDALMRVSCRACRGGRIEIGSPAICYRAGGHRAGTGCGGAGAEPVGGFCAGVCRSRRNCGIFWQPGGLAGSEARGDREVGGAPWAPARSFGTSCS